MCSILVTISSAALAGGDDGLTWSIPNTENGGTIANTGADWFNADTSISTRIPFAGTAEHDDGQDLFDVGAFALGAPDSPTAATPSQINNFLEPTAPDLASMGVVGQEDATSDFTAHSLGEVSEGFTSMKAIDTSVTARPIEALTATPNQPVDINDQYAASDRVAGQDVLKGMKPPTDIIRAFNFK